MNPGDYRITCWLGDREFGVTRITPYTWFGGEFVGGHLRSSCGGLFPIKGEAAAWARYLCQREGEKTGVTPAVECPMCDPGNPGWRDGDDCQTCGGANRVPMEVVR